MKYLIILLFISIFSLYNNLFNTYIQFDYEKINHIEIRKNTKYNFLAYMEPKNETCYLNVKNEQMILNVKKLIEKRYNYYAIKTNNIDKITNIKICYKPIDIIEFLLLYFAFYSIIICSSFLTLIILLYLYFDVLINKSYTINNSTNQNIDTITI